MYLSLQFVKSLNILNCSIPWYLSSRKPFKSPYHYFPFKVQIEFLNILKHPWFKFLVTDFFLDF
ncbi:rCG59696, isoform CRA_b, partial [Rattus norvegicus]